jgi:uncharacterized RDD family membrane protein YckC
MQADYKIIGGDGVEYGPATLEELRGWIRDGRVAGMTKVWRSDLAAWSPAARYAELGGELARLHAAAASTAKPCGFWARLGAFVIDRMVLVGMFSLLWSQMEVSQQWPPPALPAEWTAAAIQQFLQASKTWGDHAMPAWYPTVFYLIFFLYEVLMNGRFGATLGKMAVGAHIVLRDGSPLGYRRAAWRWLAERLSECLCFAGYLVIALRPDKRALHDLLAGTRVLYKP